MNRSFLLLVTALAATSACNFSGKSGSADGNVSIKADPNGNVSFDLPFAKGNVKLPQSMMQNGHFDIDGVTMIPGGTIHGFGMDAGDKGANVNLAFDAPKSPQEVRAYFLDEFRKRGDDASEQGNAITGKTRDGDHFVITVNPAANGSTGTIAVKSKS